MTVIWPALQATERKANFRNPGGASRWHTDLVHELQPAGITHLHNDTVPPIGGDTLWASGYSAYEKLSPDFRKIIDGKYAVYRSAHPYLDRENPEAGPKYSMYICYLYALRYLNLFKCYGFCFSKIANRNARS